MDIWPHRFNNQLYTAEIRAFLDLMEAQPTWHRTDFRPLLPRRFFLLLFLPELSLFAVGNLDISGPIFAKTLAAAYGCIDVSISSSNS